MRTDVIVAHNKGIQVPSSSSEFSSHDMDIKEPLGRSRLPSIMPQLDGPASVHIKGKQPAPMIRKRTMLSGGGYPSKSDSDSHGNRSHEDGRYPGRQRYYQERSRRPPDRNDSQGRGFQEEEGPLMVEDP